MIRQTTTIGVDVGGTATKAAIVDHDGSIVARVEHLTEANAGTKGVIAVVEELLAHAETTDLEVVAVGVGAAGFIDVGTGTVTFAPNLTYDDPHLGEAIRSRTKLPVIVDNDANAACWAECIHGSATGSRDVAYVGVGTGIGSGFVVEGRLVRGFTGAGAELGHTVVEVGGVRCKCGLRGCLEQYASGQAISRMAREAVAIDDESSILAFSGAIDAITARHVAQAAREYDEIARRVLRRAGRALGIGLSNVVNLFDPEVLVVGGSVVLAGEPFLGPARDELALYSQAQRRRPVRLDVGKLGDDAGIIGAAALARPSAEPVSESS